MHEQHAAKFWERVDRSAGPEGCWPWTGTRQPRGYGHFYPAWRLNLYAHRVSWEIANGQAIPAGLQVLHACDNPACVNPAHLSVGTVSDNARDCVEKGRNSPASLPGEAHPNHKLTAAGVQAIRERAAGGETHRRIAADLGVSRGRVGQIARGEAWRPTPPALAVRINLVACRASTSGRAA